MKTTINPNEAIVLIIDVQEKLVKMLQDETIGKNAVKIAKAAGILNVPTIITEQYPKGLGFTLEEIKTALPNAKYFEKTSFSALNEDGFKESIKAQNRKQIVIFGIETHICVLQTAFDLLNEGYDVYVVQNACGSRADSDKEAALRRLIHAGAQIVTVEMVLFELLKSSKNPDFKTVQALIK